jgi:hypothetical protein
MWVGGAPIFIRLGYVISSTMEVVLMVHGVGMHMEWKKFCGLLLHRCFMLRGEDQL